MTANGMVVTLDLQAAHPPSLFMDKAKPGHDIGEYHIENGYLIGTTKRSLDMTLMTVSIRPAKEPTYNKTLIGRMRRTADTVANVMESKAEAPAVRKKLAAASLGM